MLYAQAFSEKSPVVTDRGETERGKIKDASEVSPCFYRKNNGYSLTASYLFRRYLSRQGLTSEAFFLCPKKYHPKKNESENTWIQEKH